SRSDFCGSWPEAAMLGAPRLRQCEYLDLLLPVDAVDLHLRDIRARHARRSGERVGRTWARAPATHLMGLAAAVGDVHQVLERRAVRISRRWRSTASTGR